MGSIKWWLLGVTLWLAVDCGWAMKKTSTPMKKEEDDGRGYVLISSPIPIDNPVGDATPTKQDLSKTPSEDLGWFDAVLEQSSRSRRQITASTGGVDQAHQEMVQALTGHTSSGGLGAVSLLGSGSDLLSIPIGLPLLLPQPAKITSDPLDSVKQAKPTTSWSLNTPPLKGESLGWRTGSSSSNNIWRAPSLGNLQNSKLSVQKVGNTGPHPSGSGLSFGLSSSYSSGGPGYFNPNAIGFGGPGYYPGSHHIPSVPKPLIGPHVHQHHVPYGPPYGSLNYHKPSHKSVGLSIKSHYPSHHGPPGYGGGYGNFGYNNADGHHHDFKPNQLGWTPHYKPEYSGWKSPNFINHLKGISVDIPGNGWKTCTDSHGCFGYSYSNSLGSPRAHSSESGQKLSWGFDHRKGDGHEGWHPGWKGASYNAPWSGWKDRSYGHYNPGWKNVNYHGHGWKDDKIDGHYHPGWKSSSYSQPGWRDGGWHPGWKNANYNSHGWKNEDYNPRWRDGGWHPGWKNANYNSHGWKNEGYNPVGKDKDYYERHGWSDWNDKGVKYGNLGNPHYDRYGSGQHGKIPYDDHGHFGIKKGPDHYKYGWQSHGWKPDTGNHYRYDKSWHWPTSKYLVLSKGIHITKGAGLFGLPKIQLTTDIGFHPYHNPRPHLQHRIVQPEYWSDIHRHPGFYRRPKFTLLTNFVLTKGHVDPWVPRQKLQITGNIQYRPGSYW